MSGRTTPDAAQTLFYEAFSSGDLDAMMSVWANDTDIVCIHPGGSPLTGLSALRQSWQQILGVEESLEISSSPVDQWISDDVATFVVTEHLYIPSQNIRAETLATNVFRKHDATWSMVLHHGSPKPAQSRPTATASSHRVH